MVHNSSEIYMIFGMVSLKTSHVLISRSEVYKAQLNMLRWICDNDLQSNIVQKYMRKTIPKNYVKNIKDVEAVFQQARKHNFTRLMSESPRIVQIIFI